MAKAARVDDVVKNENGSISVKITTNNSGVSLPEAWGGVTLNFGTGEEFWAALADVEARVSAEDLALLQIAKGAKAYPKLDASFTTAVKAKTATLDLTGLTDAVKLG